MSENSGPDVPSDLTEAYASVRATTERLAAPLSAEDQTVQSMPDVSPTKWHRAHVTWFFETFVLGPNLAGYRPYNDAFAYIFNSYYEALGDRHPARRTRAHLAPGHRRGRPLPGVRRRGHGDTAAAASSSAGVAELITLGLHHEQQHQELLLMDIKNVLSRNPMHPAYLPECGARRERLCRRPKPGGSSTRAAWPRSGTRGRASASTTSSPATRCT